ncbi:MAG: hypothetical protein AAGA56_09615 [Myxococcota bacterium]
MHLADVIARVGSRDRRLILRDPLLLLLCAVALGSSLALRWALVAIDLSLTARGVMPTEPGGLRFRDTYGLWIGYFALWNSALLPGTVFAFLHVGEKEDGTLLAIRVTPIPPRLYLLSRVLLPYLLALAFSGLTFVLLREFTPHSIVQLVPLILGSALSAPVVTILLAAWADDKVQGFALTKFAGVLGLLIIATWFMPPPWRAVANALPPIALIDAYWGIEADGSIASASLAWGLVGQCLLLGLALRQFQEQLRA